MDDNAMCTIKISVFGGGGEGEAVVDGVGSSSERGLDWGDGGVFKESFQNILTKDLDQNRVVESIVKTEKCSSPESHLSVIYIFNAFWIKYFEIYFVI